MKPIPLFLSLWMAFCMNALPLAAQDYPPAGPGLIHQGFIEEVNLARAGINQLLADVAPGPTGQGSPWFIKVQAVKTKLDQLSNSGTQADFLAAIPAMAELFIVWEAEVEGEELPEFARKVCLALENLDVCLLYTAASYIEQQGGTVTPAALTNLVTIFRVGVGFVVEPSWEDQPRPIDNAGVMVLDATTVVNQLKALPWRQAGRFLNSAPDAATYFARYGAAGNGLAVLKTKYAQNQTVIDAKFLELKAWVAQKKAEAGKP
jgi:hypothetical protein